ncbi:hypothetical protein [Streptomyces sp. GSL17-111]|uniref:hypothetical protein n=1 Tax=Streptomyces sp. GSL17-111 TaxID=3121596 RepID=UPI0030F3F9C2
MRKRDRGLGRERGERPHDPFAVGRRARLRIYVPLVAVILVLPQLNDGGAYRSPHRPSEAARVAPQAEGLHGCGAGGPPAVAPPDTEAPYLRSQGHGYVAEIEDDAERFSVHLSLVVPETHPLALTPPVAPDGVTVELHGADGEGLMAYADGLTPRLEDERDREADSVRVTGDRPLALTVDVPTSAVCPGHRLRDLMWDPFASGADGPVGPVVTLTLADSRVGPDLVVQEPRVPRSLVPVRAEAARTVEKGLRKAPRRAYRRSP